MKKMTYTQWEALLELYQLGGSAQYGSIQNKRVIKRCIEKGYVHENKDGSIQITEVGIESAKEQFTELYRRR